MTWTPDRRQAERADDRFAWAEQELMLAVDELTRTGGVDQHPERIEAALEAVRAGRSELRRVAEALERPRHAPVSTNERGTRRTGTFENSSVQPRAIVEHFRGDLESIERARIERELATAVFAAIDDGQSYVVRKITWREDHDELVQWWVDVLVLLLNWRDCHVGESAYVAESDWLLLRNGARIDGVTTEWQQNGGSVWTRIR